MRRKTRVKLSLIRDPSLHERLTGDVNDIGNTGLSHLMNGDGSDLGRLDEIARSCGDVAESHTKVHAVGVDSPSLPGSKYLHCPSGLSTSNSSHLKRSHQPCPPDRPPIRPPSPPRPPHVNKSQTHPFHSIIFPTSPCSSCASTTTISINPPS